MTSNPLKIIAVERKEISELRTYRPKTNRTEIQAHFETLWHHTPTRFDPSNSCMDRERIARTLYLLNRACSPKDKKIVDLGCGSGLLSRALRDQGGRVTAVDVAKNALDNFQKIDAANITLVHDCVPHTKLDEGSFDVVVCADLIAHVKPKDHRLFVSELARVVKNEGIVVCSTSIDIHSEDALEKFIALMDTEFTILDWKLSHHRYYILLLDIFKSPLKFARARQEGEYRKKESEKRAYISKIWFKINTAPIFGDTWKWLMPFTNILHQFWKQNLIVMLALEGLCRFFSNETGISHVIVIAQRRPITFE